MAGDDKKEATTTFKYDNLWGETVNLGIPNIPFGDDADATSTDGNEDEDRRRRFIELEDTMPNCHHGWITSSFESKKLHYRKFLPPTPSPKAIIVFHTGIQGHSGISFHLNDDNEDDEGGNNNNGGTRKVGTALVIDKLVNGQDFAFYSLDQLGHGYSEGERFYMPDYKNCVSDLVTFAKLASNEYPKIPLFLMGISMGGNLAIHATVQIQQEQSVVPNFSGLILLCAAIKGDLPPAPITFVLRNLLAPKYPTWKPFFMPNPVSSERIWRDPKALVANTSPIYKSLGLGTSGEPMLLGTASQCLQGVEDACNHSISQLVVNKQTPLLAIHGIQDYAVPIESLDILEEKLNYDNDEDDGSDVVTIVRLPNAYHDLLCDPDSVYVMELITKFITKRISTTAT